MAKIDHAGVLERWAAGKVRTLPTGTNEDIGKVLRSLPETIDPALAVPVVLGMLAHGGFTLARTCRKLPAPVIAAVIAAASDDPDHLFLRLAMHGHKRDLVAAWQRAVQVLADLNLTYAWGSKERRRRFQALAKNPEMLAAIQGTVAHSKGVGLDMLAVLVVDGSDASFDALVPHIDLAAGDARLELLNRLRTHAARTPALDALFAEIDTALARRNAESPALALGPALGLGAVDELWFSAYVWGEDGIGSIARVQGHVDVDSRSARWFAVSMSVVERGMTSGTTWFDHETVSSDELGLGRCAALELPRWLAHVAGKLDCTWRKDITPRSNLRGAKRDKIAAWLLSSPGPAAPKRAKPRRR